MTQELDDAGTIAVLMQRLEKFRLPMALGIQEQVNKGQPLTELDIDFLTEVFTDANKAKPLLDRHPEYTKLVVKMISLYKEIVDKAVENEKNK